MLRLLSAFFHLPSDENTVFILSGEVWFFILPAGEGDCGVVTPVKQAFCSLVIQSNPKLITGCCGKSSIK